MNERTLCGAVKPSGRDCERPVPSDAPFNLCTAHLTEAYLYVRDLIKARDGLAAASPPSAGTPADAPRDGCVVYYLRFGDRIKIGTTGDIWTRIGSLPYDRLLATEPGSYDLENERHKQFKAFRLARKREWFQDCPEIRAHVNALRKQYGDPVENRYPATATAPILEDAPWER